MAVPHNSLGKTGMDRIINTSPDRHVLVHVNFGRTPLWKGAIQHRVRYDMEKVTPFGMIRAEEYVLVSDMIKKGTAVIDGEMFAKLSRAIHDEEHARYLEAGATEHFGVDAA